MNSKTSVVQWGKPKDGLQLGLWCGHTVVKLHLQNVGTQPLEVLSHVCAGETHFDWFTLHLEDDRGSKRTLRLLGDRNRSAEVRARLEPGDELQHCVDVAGWAKQSVNQGRPLAASGYKVAATYEVEARKDVWNGFITSERCTIHLFDT